jgi:endo-1,4-beta-D-glucanase Y
VHVSNATSFPASGGLSRRRLLPGMALMTAGIGAGVVQFAPEWNDVAPSRPQRASSYAMNSTPVSTAPTFKAPPSPAPKMHSAAMRQDWAAFRHQYVTPEGRVIDTGNGNASHSEGQGWGLLGAQAADDRETFERILEWTTHNLRRRPTDSLHAWRYKPGDANPVSDLNNATDGDLYIAAALARAAVRWDRPDYAAQAARLGKDILSLVRTVGTRTVLLPGAVGFEKPDCLIINPSYYAFGLFADLAAVAPSPKWELLRQEGTALILQARYGKWMLPPDWVRVDRADGSLGIAPGWPPRFSWDAIRVPMHLAWGGIAAEPLFASFHKYWTAQRAVQPAWVDLRTEEVAPYSAPAGIRAVATLASHTMGMDRTSALPSVMAANDYYGAGLVLLSRIAAEEAGRPI